MKFGVDVVREIHLAFLHAIKLSDYPKTMTSMGVGYALLEALLRTMVGRTILRYVSKVSSWIKDWGQETVLKEIEIDDSEIKFRSASGTPTPAIISFRISSRSPIEIEISALALRIGYSEGGMTIRNIIWSRDISSEPPQNIDLRGVDEKADSWQSLEFILPPYLYFEEGRRRLYVSGTLTLDTVFGSIEFPIYEHVNISSEDLEELDDTREFFESRMALTKQSAMDDAD